MLTGKVITSTSLAEYLPDSTFLWYLLPLGLLYFLTRYTFWATRGVPCPSTLPFFGNAARYIMLIAPLTEVHDEYYKKYKGKPFFGVYEFRRPLLVLREPELIERVLVKDFQAWTDRGTSGDLELEPLTHHLVNLNGAKWRALRTKLTPVFSSGKLKLMLDQLISCSDKMVGVVGRKVDGGTPLEVKDQMSCFTLDVIGSCAFGLDLNVLENPNSTFMKIGKQVFQPSSLGLVRFFMRSHFPFFLKLFGWKSMPKAMEDFFINTVKSTVQNREENNFYRNDFIQLLMEIRKQEENTNSTEMILDDKTFAANAFVFLLAGYETTASTLSFLLYELSKKPHIQDKLYNEGKDVLGKYKGELTWEAIKDLTYLDQCISETLRMHPSITTLRRKSRTPYRIPDTSIELPAGTSVLIPVYSIHHDPLYYPNPYEFIPERFSEENKHKQVKYTYLPFGEGPRICIGIRFAKVEIKVAMLKLIQEFKISLNPRTRKPLKYSRSALLGTVDGIWIDFVPRTKKT